MKKNGLLVFTLLLAGCGANTVNYTQDNVADVNSSQYQGIVQQIRYINSQSSALSSQDIPSDPSDIPSTVPQDVYIDVLPGDVAASTSSATLESVYIGQLAQGEKLNEQQVTVAVQKYIASRPDVYTPPLITMGNSSNIRAQDNIFTGVRLCERRIDQPHPSGSKAVRGQLIVKGAITCPPTPYNYRVTASIQLEQLRTFYYVPFNSPSVLYFSLVPGQPKTIGDYQYNTYAPCTNGTYRGRSEASYVGGPYGQQYTFQPTRYGAPKNVQC